MIVVVNEINCIIVNKNNVYVSTLTNNEISRIIARGNKDEILALICLIGNEYKIITGDIGEGNCVIDTKLYLKLTDERREIIAGYVRKNSIKVKNCVYDISLRDTICFEWKDIDDLIRQLPKKIKIVEEIDYISCQLVEGSDLRNRLLKLGRFVLND